jgi:hypothetical protein
MTFDLPISTLILELYDKQVYWVFVAFFVEA